MSFYRVIVVFIESAYLCKLCIWKGKLEIDNLKIPDQIFVIMCFSRLLVHVLTGQYPVGRPTPYSYFFSILGLLPYSPYCYSFSPFLLFSPECIVGPINPFIPVALKDAFIGDISLKKAYFGIFSSRTVHV